MTDPIQSPSRLVRKKAPRLNKVPLVIAAGVLASFGGVIGYTALERAHRQQREVAASKDRPVTPALVPGFIAARAAERPATLPQQVSRMPAPPAVVGPQIDDPRAAAWKAYYQELNQVQKQKAQAAAKAMTAGTDADAGSDTGVGGGRGPMVASVGPGQSGGGVGHAAGGLPVAGVDAGAQAEKRAFMKHGGDVLGLNEDLSGSVHGPKRDTVMEGTAIPGVMMGGINSDMPGMIVARVTHAVYDSETGDDLLIPQNSKLLGTYDNSVSNGQSRIGVIWNRIIFPDSSSRQIGSMEGADQGGYAGFHDRTNTHFWEKFGAATLLSIGGAAAQLAQPQQSAFSGYSPSSVATGAMTQQYSTLGQEYARSGMSIPNTLQVRPGYRFVVMVNKDMTLPPYVDRRGAQAQSVSVGQVMR